MDAPPSPLACPQAEDNSAWPAAANLTHPKIVRSDGAPLLRGTAGGHVEVPTAVEGARRPDVDASGTMDSRTLSGRLEMSMAK